MFETEHKVNVAFVGHVDHGKSSILGRLLVETNSLPDGKLEQLKNYCATHAKDFEYAFLTDALEKEQSQGITIDSARYFIRTEGRKFLFIDTPGHLDFIKNMITGSSTADIAFLIVDAKEGLKENTLRHLFLLSFLKIPQIFVLINKMDQVGYSENNFQELAGEIQKLFHKQSLPLSGILPISAKYGDHFTTHSSKMDWYRGPTLWQSLCSYKLPGEREGGELRLPLQDIYRFSKAGDARRIYAGTIASGSLQKGDRVRFSPSQKEGIISTIESDRTHPSARYAVGFTLQDPIFVERGELISRVDEDQPIVSQEFKVRLFWISRRPMNEGAKLMFRLHTSRVPCAIQKISSIYDSSSLAPVQKKEAGANDIVECVIQTAKPVAFDLAPHLIDTNRFVLVDQYEMVGNGIILSRAGQKNETASLQSRILIFSGGADQISYFEKKLKEQGTLVYSIRVTDFSTEKGNVEVMVKVCRDLGATCLIHVTSLSRELKETLEKAMPDIIFVPSEIHSLSKQFETIFA